MKIKWYAHAAFRFEGDGLSLITDPYTPEEMNYQGFPETADIVIRSSDDDSGHCRSDLIPGQPQVVTATEVGPEGVTVRGLRIAAVPAQESLIHKAQPLDNAMYMFTLDGVRVAHLGDVGNRLDDGQLAALAGSEVVLAPTGGPPTLDLDDLVEALNVLRPKLIIPMHFHLPSSAVKMLPASAFTGYFPAEAVEHAAGAEIEVTRNTLPAETRVVVLQPSTA